MDINTIEKAFLSSSEFVEKQALIEEFFDKNVEFIKVKIGRGRHFATAHRLKKENPEDTLVIIPGRGEIAHKYAELFYSLSKLNIDVIVVFARGQGQSSRYLKDTHKCHINCFSNFSKDILQVLNHLQVKKYKILSFSLGGLISLDIIKNWGFRPQKAALISPYIWPYFQMNRYLIMLIAYSLGSPPYLSTLYTPYGKEYKRVPFDTNHHSHCKERYEYYHDYYASHNELTIGCPTYGFVCECIKKQLELLNSSFSFKVPVYIQSSGDDKVVNTLMAKQFFDQHSIDRLAPKFEIIENAYHDILNESDEYRVKSLSKALAFLFAE